MSDNETNYVAGLATRWARTDPMEQWVNAAPEGGRTPLDETIREYLGSHNPFPAHPNRGCRSWGPKPPVSSRLRAM